MKINNTLLALQPQTSTQTQPVSKLKLQQLDRDTLSFQGNESLFLFRLQTYLKEKSNPEYILELINTAKGVNPENQEIVKAVKNIEQNSEISDGAKKTLKTYVFNQFGKKPYSYFEECKERFAL